MTLDFIFEKIREELETAAEKHPDWTSDPLHALGVIQEEIGEAAKEILEGVYMRATDDAMHDKKVLVRRELIQAAAMIVCFLHNDATLDWSIPHEKKLPKRPLDDPARRPDGTPYPDEQD